MGFDLSSFSAKDFEARRYALAGRLGPRAVMIPSGRARPRNYAANT
jgi:hypothetical protein